MAYPIPQNLIRDCSTTTQNIHGASRAENTMTMDEKKKKTQVWLAHERIEQVENRTVLS
jgi:hypothetical protein